MELARSCQPIRDRIRACRRPAEPVDDDDDDDDDDERTAGAPTTNHHHGLVAEAETLERELENGPPSPRCSRIQSWGRRRRSRRRRRISRSRSIMPRVVSGDRDFARALLNSSDIMPLPIEVQKTLWDGPHLPSTEGSGC
jgi:hypothetical protein